MTTERTTKEQPRVIGRYQIRRLLGQGGMGRVWLAHDTVLERDVAIKVLRDDLALPPTIREELVVRMRHEARAAARVSHPNIVTLHDMGEDEHVGLYLVFEYVAGTKRAFEPSEVEPTPARENAQENDGPESLRERLREGRMPLAEVAVLARQLGDALSFAHKAGVIHRDVKPENVLFSATGAKVADFGIARIPDSNITRQDTVLGTPAYTAPEALSNGDFGPASDQFSLAATLYEAITGARAFDGENALVAVEKVAKEAPPPLDSALAGPALLKALTTALERGLSKRPEERFRSATALGQAVARAIENPPSIDAPIDAPVFRTPIPFPTFEKRGDAPSESFELERAPLSSRMVAAERAAKARLQSNFGPSTEARPLETPSPASVIARQQTERFQNVLVAVALVVIVLLVVFGRKRSEPVTIVDSIASVGPPSATMTTAPPQPPKTPRVHPSGRTALNDVAGPKNEPRATNDARGERGDDVRGESRTDDAGVAESTASDASVDE